MQIKFYLFPIFLYNLVIVIQTLDFNDNSDEVEIFKHLFIKLNTILNENGSLQKDLSDIKNGIQQLYDKINQVPNNFTITSYDSVLSCNSNSLSATPNSGSLGYYCFGENWLIIQRRSDGSENFYRDWNDYKHGFGNKSGEFFLGLDKIHHLTSIKPYELLVVMEDFDNSKRYAKYDKFEIGGEDQQYALKTLDKYSGNAGDSLTYHRGSKFSTKGRDNDQHTSFNCAEKLQSGWWFKSCHESNLNGCYNRKNLQDPKIAVACGIHWKTFRGQWYSLKSVEIMIRPKV